MPCLKQPPRTILQLFGPDFCVLVRELFQEPDVAYQMSPAVLGHNPEVPRERAVGREVIEIQIAREFLTDKFVGRFQSESLDVFVSDFLVKRFIDAFRWQVFPQMPLMSRLATAFRLTLPPRLFRRFWLGDITGWWFR